MINKVCAINFNRNSNNRYSPRLKEVPHINFCAVKLYNDRPDGIQKTMRTVILNFRKIKRNIKKFFTPDNTPKTDNTAVNNHFINKIKQRFSNIKIIPGEFEFADGNIFEIKLMKNGNKKIKMYKDDAYDKHFPHRTIIVDSNDDILRYETSKPWRVFIKDGDTYQCCDNIDAYVKSFLREPEYMFELNPKF